MLNISVDLYCEEFESFINVVSTEVDNFCRNIKVQNFDEAANIIAEAERHGGRIHITGVGKPSHVAAYIASLFSSTGTIAYQLDCTEAVHGSAGQIAPGDVVIAISNSGETEELKRTVVTVKNNGAKIIGVSGDAKSWIASISDVYLYAGVGQEGGPLNRAPRSSIVVEIIVLQALSVLLQCRKNLTVRQYIKWHPGGTLGRLRDNEI